MSDKHTVIWTNFNKTIHIKSFSCEELIGELKSGCLTDITFFDGPNYPKRIQDWNRNWGVILSNPRQSKVITETVTEYGIEWCDES